MMQNKVLGLAANIVLCTLLLMAGCSKHAEEPAQTKIEPEKTILAEVEFEEQEPTVTLAQKYTPGDSTTYKVTTEADNSLIWESADPNKPKGFTGGHTGRKSEITFTQQIQSIDDKGNAIAVPTYRKPRSVAVIPIIDSFFILYFLHLKLILFGTCPAS